MVAKSGYDETSIVVDDAEVVQRNQSRSSVIDLDRHRFLKDLHRTHWRELCGWLRRRYGPGPPEPEDIAQTAFCKIAQMDDLAIIADPKAFLFTVAARTAISGFRWRTSTRDFIERELQMSGLEVEEIDPERVYQAKERLQMVLESMGQLTEMQRELVKRSRLLGQTYAEIAQDTGWSLASISRNLQAALISVGRVLADADSIGGEE